MLSRFWRDSRAATVIEYGLIAGLVSVAIVVAARAIGTTLATNYYGKVVASFN